jgi:hypothetical protein
MWGPVARIVCHGIDRAMHSVIGFLANRLDAAGAMLYIKPVLQWPGMPACTHSSERIPDLQQRKDYLRGEVSCWR